MQKKKKKKKINGGKNQTRAVVKWPHLNYYSSDCAENQET